MRFIVFVDALDFADVQAASNGWFKELAKQYIPNVPRVTPNVISQIMTGKRREDLGFMRSTPYKKPRKTGLRGETILHYTTSRNLRVFQYGIPLCATVQLPQGSISTFDHFLGKQPVPPILQFAQARKNFQKDDLDNIFNAYVDEATTMFSTIRNIARNGQFDVFWLGYQPIDAYTHWYDENARRDLIKVVEAELQQIQADLHADILFFSDHGSTKKKKMFRLNIWLKENGWLDYEVYYKLLDFHRPKNIELTAQIPLNSPYVYINWDKTKFYCNDAFDAMIDATDKATDEDKEELKKQLMQTGFFDSIALKEELFCSDGEHYDELPDVIPETADGICTSCNIHKDAETGKNIGNMRTGWHSKRASYGCTDKELSTAVSEPTDVYKLMKEFVDKEEPKEQEQTGNADDAAVLENLAALGYV